MHSTLGAAALVVFAVWCLALSVIDIRERRLPNRLTLPGAAAVLGYGAAVGQAPAALLGGCTLAALYLVVHLAAPASFGAGDVKAALGLGAAAATHGSHAWAVAGVAAPALTAVLGVVASARRGTRALPHGPSMCAATVLAVVWG